MIITKRAFIVAAMPLLAMSSAVFAAGAQTSAVRDNGFSYNYLQVGYENRDYDGFFETDGLDGKLSYELDEHLFIRAGLQIFKGDFETVSISFAGFFPTVRTVDEDINGNELSGGIGFHTPLQTGTDLVMTGDLVRIDYDFDDEIGFALAGGVRHAATEQLELSGGVFLEDVVDSEFGVQGGALYHANKQFDMGANLKLGSDVTTFALFGRYSF